MIKQLLFIIVSLLFAIHSMAQKATVSGYVQDAATGEKLIGATVYSKKTLAGTTSNNFGFYSITLDTGSVTLAVSYVGYAVFEKTVELHDNLFVIATLSADTEIDEVVVSARANDQMHLQSQMGSVRLETKQLEKLPAFMGERDIIKSIQLTPGVQSGSEGTSGLYVRGGGPDQNLILLDGVPVYNATHLFGFFSVFNSSSINSVEIIKGGFPARYGGRTSSVLDIKMKDGNNSKIAGEGAIGLLSSKLMLEGPILKEKATFMVSARRTYFDVMAQPFIMLANVVNDSDSKTKGGYYFYDLNAKLNYKFSDKSRLYLSSYSGKDRVHIKSEFKDSYDGNTSKNKSKQGVEWGNITSALRYNQILSPKLFSNITATYSSYRFVISAEDKRTGSENGRDYSERMEIEYLSGIFDWGLKADLDYLPHPDHYIRFGVGDTYHTFKPGVFSYSSRGQASVMDTSIGSRVDKAHEMYVYAEDDIKITQRLKTNLGAHYSAFATGSALYHTIEPRISVYYLLSENLSAKAAYTRMTQYMHLLTNGTIGLPTDLWVPVTDSVPPMAANQYAAGLAYTLRKRYEFSAEVYYKDMKNLIEYKDGASFVGTSENWDKKVEIGTGNSYGLELFAQKKAGKTTGWVGYTLSWSNRQFDQLNSGRTFPYKYDRRHDMSIAVVHSFDKKETQRWHKDLGMTWVYGTGNAVSLPTATYKRLEDKRESQYWGPGTIESIDKRNDYREPAYHRMDVSLSLSRTEGKTERMWNISVYNAYNRHNPFYIYFDSNDTNERRLMLFSLLPVIPAFSYTIKF